jgi:hypothetical protein
VRVAEVERLLIGSPLVDAELVVRISTVGAHA